MASSVGSLYIDILARTGSLEKDMARAKAEMKSLGEATKKVGGEAASAFKSLKLFDSFQGRGMTGITLDMWAFMMAISAVQRELKYVWDNIDRIPGINPTAVASVNTMKESVYDLRLQIDGLIASGLGLAADFGRSIGYTMGTIFSQTSWDDMGKAIASSSELASPDKLALMEDPKFYDKVTEAQKKLREARMADNVAAMDQGDRINELREQAARYFQFSDSGNLNLLQSVEAQNKAFQLSTQANREMASMRKTYTDNLIKETVELDKNYISNLSQRDAMKEIQKQIRGINDEWDNAGRNGTAPDNDPKQLELANKYYPTLLMWMGKLREEQKKLSTANLEFTNVFIQGFAQVDQHLTNFVTGAESQIDSFLKTISDQIINTFFKLAIINPMMNALFGGVKGFQVLPMLLGGASAKADGGPAHGLTLVGERGPELLRLGSGSTIIPNHSIRGGGGGGTYIIDARGADEARIQHLENLIRGLNGSIERRALAANHTAKSRRQM